MSVLSELTELDEWRKCGAHLHHLLTDDDLSGKPLYDALSQATVALSALLRHEPDVPPRRRTASAAAKKATPRRTNDKPAGPVTPSEKYCPKCDETKSTEGFNKNRSARDGLQSYCRACQSVRERTTTAKAAVSPVTPIVEPDGPDDDEAETGIVAITMTAECPTHGIIAEKQTVSRIPEKDAGLWAATEFSKHRHSTRCYETVEHSWSRDMSSLAAS